MWDDLTMADATAVSAQREQATDAAIADVYRDICAKMAQGLPPAAAEAEFAAASDSYGWDINSIARATRRSYDDVRLWAVRMGLIR